jgi:16S rRNA (guanine527-N7)-methyltransferase
MTVVVGEVCLQLGLRPTEGQLGELAAFLALLQRWNATYNLTALRDPQKMITHHLADCLAAVEPLRRHLGARAPARLLDVGSGGALPGAVLAIMLPELEVTCVDAVGKKAAFVRQVAAELGLRNLRAEHARVEAMVGTGWDIVASRAFASLADFVRLTRNRLADNGTWMAMKGKHPDQELAELPPDIDVFHVEPLTVPGLLDAERCLVWMRPRQVT